MTGRRRRQMHHQIISWLKRPDFEKLQIFRRLRAAAVPALLVVFIVFGGANGEALGVHGRGQDQQQAQDNQAFDSHGIYDSGVLFGDFR